MTEDRFDIEYDSLIDSMPIKCRDCGHNYAEEGSEYCSTCKWNFEGELDVNV